MIVASAALLWNWTSIYLPDWRITIKRSVIYCTKYIFTHEREVSWSAKNVKDAWKNVAHQQLVLKKSLHSCGELLESWNLSHAARELLHIATFERLTFFWESVTIRFHRFGNIIWDRSQRLISFLRKFFRKQSNEKWNNEQSHCEENPSEPAINDCLMCSHFQSVYYKHHQAPIHRGSLLSIKGVFVGSMYIFSEMNPKTNPIAKRSSIKLIILHDITSLTWSQSSQRKRIRQ